MGQVNVITLVLFASSQYSCLILSSSVPPISARFEVAATLISVNKSEVFRNYNK